VIVIFTYEFFTRSLYLRMPFLEYCPASRKSVEQFCFLTGIVYSDLTDFNCNNSKKNLIKS
jgi:hypothetical protein